MDPPTTMKHYRYWLCLILLPLTFPRVWADNLGPIESGMATNGVQMAIRLKGHTNEVPVNQAVELVISYRNVRSNETFTVYRANSIEDDSHYTIFIISPTGKDISPDLFRMGRFSESGGLVRLAPHQTIELEFNLSRLVKFERVGTYKVILKNSIFSPQRNKTFRVVSNPLYLVVTR